MISTTFETKNSVVALHCHDEDENSRFFGLFLALCLLSIFVTSEILVGPLDGPHEAGRVPIDALDAVEGVPDGKAIVVGIHNGCIVIFKNFKNN